MSMSPLDPGAWLPNASQLKIIYISCVADPKLHAPAAFFDAAERLRALPHSELVTHSSVDQ